MAKIADIFSVAGQCAIVTGGASGIGLGYTEALAENGARVTMLDINAERIRTETKRLNDLGYNVRGLVADVSDHPALDKAVDEAVAAMGRLDVCFANAGIESGPGFLSGFAGRGRPRNPEGAIENYTSARWQRVIDVNLGGIFATVRAAARHMKPRKQGRIIVTTSIAALRAEPAVGVAYMAAKAGAAHFMRNVALELAPYNICVNAIAPGFIVTNIGAGLESNLAVKDVIARDVPMRRAGFPEDIKGLALLLASPASAYITGAEIPIDGGWTLGSAD